MTEDKDTIICNVCQVEKSKIEYYSRYKFCKTCFAIKAENRKLQNPEKYKKQQKKSKAKYRQANREKLREANREYSRLNKEKIKIRMQVYTSKNKERKKLSDIVYRQNNKEDISKRRKEKSHLYKAKMLVYGKKWKQINKDRLNIRAKLRRTTDIQFRIQGIIRHRLNLAVKNNKKIGSAVADLGCSISELKQNLESRFQIDMTWDNYGNGENNWVIDHTIPLAYFDLTDKFQFKLANNYKNLQPLWRNDNLKKSYNLPNNLDEKLKDIIDTVLINTGAKLINIRKNYE